MANNGNKNSRKPVKERYSKGFTDVSGRDSFYRSKVEIGRWSLGMQIIRENFGTLVGFNVLMLLFVAPIFVILFLRLASLAVEIYEAPFAANIGLGFQPNVNLAALPQSLVFGVDSYYFLFLPLAVLWLGLGLAGGMFVMRNLCWGERVSLFKTIFLGIKRHAIPVLLGTLVYSLFLTGGIIGFSYIDLAIALNGSAWYFILAKIAIIVVLIYLTLWYLTYVSMGVSYKANAISLAVNSLKVTTVLLPLNLFFAALAFVGFVLLFFGESVMFLGLLLVAVFAVSFAMLVWSVYSQWVYDRLINPSIKEKYVPTEEEKQAKKNREEAVKRQQEMGDGFITVGESRMKELGEVLPISKGSVEMVRFNRNFTRADLSLAEEKKKQMLNDVDADQSLVDGGES